MEDRGGEAQGVADPPPQKKHPPQDIHKLTLTSHGQSSTPGTKWRWKGAALDDRSSTGPTWAGGKRGRSTRTRGPDSFRHRSANKPTMTWISNLPYIQLNFISGWKTSCQGRKLHTPYLGEKPRTLIQNLVPLYKTSYVPWYKTS
jgi:hypothetical protein